MKKLIILLLFIPFSILSAANGDQLDLGNVIIQGETTSLSDTLNFARNLEEYCQLSSPEQFEYEDYFSTMQIDPAITYPSQERIALLLQGGLNNYISVRGVFSSGKIWQFSANLLNNHRYETSQQKMVNFQWQPEVNDHKVIFDLTRKEYTAEYGETDISGGFISYKNQGYIIPQIPQFSWNIDLKGSYNEYTQIALTKKSQTDVDLISNIGIIYRNIRGTFSANRLMQTISGFCGANYSNLKFFDRIGFWCAYDASGVYPSINLSSKLYLNNNLKLRFENIPTISKLSRADEFNKNLLQYLVAGDYQTKGIINSYITLESEYILPISLYYNAKYEKDHLRYVENTLGFYNLENIDCLIHNVGFKAAYKYNNLSAIQNTEYIISEDQLYWEPLFISTTTLVYEGQLYNAGVDLRILSGGENDRGIKPKNALLMDVSALYRLRNNISILGEIKNLFNQEYKKFDNYKIEELQFVISIKMTF